MFSTTEMTVDSAAQLMNTKKRVPHIPPPGMELKILGSVMNTSPGPLSGLTPKAKQAGKIIRPAVKATKVSSPTISVASPVSVRLRSR